MDASIQPNLIVRRPTLSWCTRALSCALVRLLQSLAKDPRRAGVSRVSLKPPLPGRQASCARIPHVRATGRHALLRARASRRLFVAQTLPFEDGTPRRFLRRRSLVTADRSRRRSHLRLHIPGVHCCTPVCRGESIRRPIPALPGRFNLYFNECFGLNSGLSSSGLHNPYIGHTGQSTVIPKK